METKANYVVIGAFTFTIAIAAVLFGLFAARYATDSASMKKDAACSLCGATLSLGVCVGAGVHRNSRLWWIDATVAVVVSAGLLLYGLFTLAKNAQQGNRWWSPTFWMVAPKRCAAPVEGRHHASNCSKLGAIAIRRGDAPAADLWEGSVPDEKRCHF